MFTFLAWSGAKRMCVVLITALALLSMTLVSIGAASAATFTVTTTNDSGPGSLRQAILDSTSGSDILFHPSLANGTIVLQSHLPTIDNTIDIDGGVLNITIDGGLVARAGFIVDAGVRLDVSRLTFTRGRAPTSGADYFRVDEGDLNLVSVNLVHGGGNPPTLDNGILAVESDVSISGSNFIDFSEADTTNSGVLRVQGGTLSINGSRFEDNRTTLGSIVLFSVDDVSITDTDFINNTVVGGQGSSVAADASNVMIDNSRFVDNDAGVAGGALAADDGSVLTVQDSTFTSNSAAGFFGNPISGGGAIWIGGGAHLDLTSSTFDGNRVGDSGSGGAINVEIDSSAEISNSSFIGNFIMGEGNGGATFNNGTMTLTHVTQSTNAFGATGGYYGNNHGTGDSGTTTIHNSVLAGSSFELCGNMGTTTLTHTLLESAGSNLPALTCLAPAASGNITDIDPDLGPLQNNGGITDTMAIEASSAAANTGGSACAAVDQRGEPRPATACDMGAYEVPTPPVFCNRRLVTINMNLPGVTGMGSPKDDVILGTPFDDVIDGLSGDDTVCAGDGDDTVRGGPGVDWIYGEAGEDTIRGGGFGDKLYGGDDDDVIDGQGGADMIFGGSGDDTIDGRGAADTIDGGAGDDEINGQNGADIIDGGLDDDEIKGQTGPDELTGDDGDDDLLGGNGNDTLYGGAGIDKCAGNLGTEDEAEAATCETTPGVEILF